MRRDGSGVALVRRAAGLGLGRAPPDVDVMLLRAGRGLTCGLATRSTARWIRASLGAAMGRAGIMAW